jgi:hypothetical protein
MKSRATWLELSNNNTKFLHSFANHRNNINTIWELQGQDGIKISGFKALANLGVKYFEGLFREPDRVNMAKKLKIISFFSRMIDNVHSEDLFKLVVKEELLAVLQSLW